MKKTSSILLILILFTLISLSTIGTVKIPTVYDEPPSNTSITTVNEIYPTPYQATPAPENSYESEYLYHNPINYSTVPLTVNDTWAGQDYFGLNTTTNEYYLSADADILKSTPVHRTMQFSFRLKFDEKPYGTFTLYVHTADYEYPRLSVIVSNEGLVMSASIRDGAGYRYNNDPSPGLAWKTWFDYSMWYIDNGTGIITRLYVDNELIIETFSEYSRLALPTAYYENSVRIDVASGKWYIDEIHWSEMPHLLFEEIPTSITTGDQIFQFRLRRGALSGDFTVIWNASLELPNGTKYGWNSSQDSPDYYLADFTILRYIYTVTTDETTAYTEDTNWVVQFNLTSQTPDGTIITIHFWVIDEDKGWYDFIYIGDPGKEAIEVPEVEVAGDSSIILIGAIATIFIIILAVIVIRRPKKGEW